MNDTYKTLLEVLENDERLVIDGKLAKNKIVELALKTDEKLITLLKGNSELFKVFFKKIGDITIFDQHKFQSFVSNKQFLPDSFTEYKNKIGLLADKNYISESREVVLAFPYKDCVLEGGQTKEDAKRDEVFWNETLAPDEIDKLLLPKVLSNFKTFEMGIEKQETKVNFENNLVLKGNNLLLLHSLYKKYQNQVQLLYLDPPYNTSGEANTFLYNNTFNHSSWLTFMKNRLEIGKELVKDEGFICVSIDDEEQAYLKVLCDEVLGRDNFIGTVIVQVKKEGRTDKKFFATSHDYAMFYAKNINKAKINNLLLSEESAKKWKEVDEIGRYFWRSFVRTGGNSTPKARPKQFFPIYIEPKSERIIGVGGYNQNKDFESYVCDKVFTLSDEGDVETITLDEFKQKYPNSLDVFPSGKKGEKQVWRWSDRSKILFASGLGEIKFIGKTIKIKDRTREGSKPTTTWYDSDFNATTYGTLLLKKIFKGDKVFSYPKSLYTMMDIIQVTTSAKNNDIVLDAFGGSATTAQAIIELNKKDQGNRKFILCEQLDYAEDVTCGRINKISKTEENVGYTYAELRLCNQIYADKILKAKSEKELEEIYLDMSSKAFLSYKVEAKKIDFESLRALDLDNQKKLLLSILDKNILYVPFSEIDDDSFEISDADKKLNRSFYEGNR